ncbi:MAG: MotA/TolQ/ExbB proton channel family protein, partial [Lentisphaeria bacterium]|nr:MotA/TolQ/ExbB proton channel family protein [Lentisphaeria bacterium]
LFLILCFSSSIILAAVPTETLKETYSAISNKRQLLVDKIASLKAENRLKLEVIESNRKSNQQTLRELKALKASSYETVSRYNQLCQSLNTDKPIQYLDESLTKATEKINKVAPANSEVFLKDGSSIQGKLTQYGPIAYFESTDQGIQGIAIEQNDIFLLKEVKYGPRLFPVYFSKKEALMDTESSFVEHLKKGKVAIIPMIILAIVCLFVAIFRSLALVGIVKKQYEVEVKEIAHVCSDDKGKALGLAQQLPRPLNTIMVEAVKHHHISKEHLEEVLYERVTLEIPTLDKWLTVLAVGASAAPLLGLLGTVTGMIHTFALITQHGSGDAALLSSGISEALITTEVGLVIAIPALIIHAWLSNKVSRSIALTQKGALIFVNALKVK